MTHFSIISIQISLLIPLVESRELHIPGRSADSHVVSSDFRLFLTRRSRVGAQDTYNAGVDMIAKQARRITLPSISETYLKKVVKHAIVVLDNHSFG